MWELCKTVFLRDYFSWYNVINSGLSVSTKEDNLVTRVFLFFVPSFLKTFQRRMEENLWKIYYNFIIFKSSRKISFIFIIDLFGIIWKEIPVTRQFLSLCSSYCFFYWKPFLSSTKSATVLRTFIFVFVLTNNTTRPRFLQQYSVI